MVEACRGLLMLLMDGYVDTVLRGGKTLGLAVWTVLRCVQSSCHCLVNVVITGVLILRKWAFWGCYGISETSPSVSVLLLNRGLTNFLP